MTSTSIEHFRRQLLAKKRRIERLAKALKENSLGESLLESTQELSRYDNHPGDLGSEEFERSKDLALWNEFNNRLQEIEETLASIDDGTYGCCSICGQEIPLERLEAMPETTLCLQCRQRAEKEGRRRRRPIEEEVILPPFGRQTFDPYQEHLETSGEVEYDGEDVWQDLARTNEHAPGAGSGAYYGPLDLEEKRGSVEEVEERPYFRSGDGIFYGQHSADIKDEGDPEEKVLDENSEPRLENNEPRDKKGKYR